MKYGNNKTKLEASFDVDKYIRNPEKRAAILQTISKLPVNQSIALISYYYGGLSIQEITVVMRAPDWVAAQCLERAKENVLKELGMIDVVHDMPDEPPTHSVLKQIFDRIAEDMITDEQVQRILEPIRRMIEAGEFDKHDH